MTGFCEKDDCADGGKRRVENGDVKDRRHRVILLGSPGSGKGTVAQWLSRILGVPHVSTGAMFRKAAHESGPHAESIRRFIDKGQLVPDDIVVEAVRRWLDEQDSSRGFIFDGFPRTLPQAKAIDRLLAERQTPITMAILLEVSEAETIERILGRLSCEKCGALYHVTRVPPKRKAVCDVCNAPLVRREDDVEQTVRDRMRVYERQTKDVVKHYESTGWLRRVDGSGMKETAFASVLPLFQS